MKLLRNPSTADGTFGELKDDRGYRLAYTLEPAIPVIPLGVYACVRGTHQLKDGPPFQTFEITGIPGHSGLLFHSGNTIKDTEGCVLLGTSVMGKTLIESRKAFAFFMDQMRLNVDGFNLSVEEEEEET